MQPLTDAQRDLAGDPAAVRMAECAAARFTNRLGEQGRYDEYLSAALWGLCDAAARFEPGRGLKFTTYAEDRVWGAMLDCRRERMGHGFGSVGGAVRRNEAPAVCSTAAALRGSERGETVGSSLASGDPPAGWDLECEEEVRRLTRGLGSAGATVRLLLLRAGLGGSQGLVGEHMGLSESRVSQLVVAAVRVMRQRAGVANVERHDLGLRDEAESKPQRRERRRQTDRAWRARRKQATAGQSRNGN